MATVAPVPRAATEDKQWFALSGEDVASDLGVDIHAGLASDEAARRLEQYGPNAFVAAQGEPRWRAFVRQYRDPMQIVLLVAGHREHLAAARARHRPRPALPDAVQRRSRPEPGGQGGGGGRRAPEDDDHQGEGPPERRADPDPGRAARPRRRRLDRGRRRRAGGRPAAEDGDARGRRVGADRREPAGSERRRDRHAAGRTAGRPDRHGLHEHERHAWHRRVRRHHHRHGDRGRSHLGHARAGERPGLAAHEAAQQADEPDPRHLGHRAGDLDRPEHVARRVVQDGLSGGDRVRDRRDPHRAPRCRHGDPLDGDAEARRRRTRS